MKIALLTGFLTALGLVISSIKEKGQQALGLAPGGFDVSSGINKGKVDSLKYYSSLLNSERKALIYTPPGYSPAHTYPVLYLLHGIGGDEYSWFIDGQAHMILDNLIHQGEAEPMIVIFPNGRAMKDDRPLGNLFSTEKLASFEQFEEDLLGSLLPAVEAAYSVCTDSGNRALAGASMGAGQVLNIGMAHPDVFAWLGAFSPAPNTKSPEELVHLAARQQQMQDLLWISSGLEDRLLPIAESRHEYFEELDLAHEYHLSEGGHNYELWKNDLYWFAKKIFKPI